MTYLLITKAEERRRSRRDDDSSKFTFSSQNRILL